MARQDGGGKRSNALLAIGRWLVGKSLRHRGDMREFSETLVHATPMGHMWTLLQCVLSLAIVVLWVMQTYAYANSKSEPWFVLPAWVEYTVVGLVAVDYALLYVASANKWTTPSTSPR